MSIGSGLLAIATGALAGTEQGREQRRANELRNLELLSSLSKMPGVVLNPDTGAPAAPAAPSAPAAPHGPAAAPAGGIAADIGGRAGSAVLRAAADTLGQGAPAPSAAPVTAAPAPSHVLHVGSLSIGGQTLGIGFDPTQTKEARNRAAYERLESETPGSQGVFDPDFDYAAAERTERKHAQLTQALLARGYNRQDAELLAKYNIDLEGKEAERRARAMTLDAERQALADHQRQQAEQEATGAAESMVANGLTDPNQVAQSLTGPWGARLPAGILAGIAQKAVAEHARQAAAKTASAGRGVLHLPGGITIDPATLAPASAGAGPATDAAPDAGLPALTPGDLAHARHDPEFAAFLRSKGYQLPPDPGD